MFCTTAENFQKILIGKKTKINGKNQLLQCDIWQETINCRQSTVGKIEQTTFNTSWTLSNYTDLYTVNQTSIYQLKADDKSF